MTKNENTEAARPIDVDALVALVESAKTAWTESIGSERSAVEACAVAAYAARDLIGDPDHYADVDAYRANFVSRQADKDGIYGPVSKSTITLWTRLGLAHSLGITPESERQVWTRLQSKGNSDSRMRDALKAENKPTAAKVKRAVNGCYKGGKYVPVAKGTDTPATPAGQNHGNTGPVSENTEAPVSVPAMLDMLDVIALRLSTEPISPEEFKRLSTVVETLSGISAATLAVVEEHRAA